MVSHIHYNNFNVDHEDFVMFLTSKFIICFIDIHLHTFGFILGMKSQSIAYLLRESDVYWILGLQGEVHSIWDLWTNDLQECKNTFYFYFETGRARQQLLIKIKNTFFGGWGYLGCWSRARPWDPLLSMIGSWLGWLRPAQMAWAHNIVKIHNSVLLDWQYFHHNIPSFRLNMRNILHNIFSPT